MSTAQLLQLGDGGRKSCRVCKGLGRDASCTTWLQPLHTAADQPLPLLPRDISRPQGSQKPCLGSQSSSDPPGDATGAGAWLLQAQPRGTDSHHSPAGHVWAGNATDTALPSPTALHEVRTLLLGGDAGLPTLALGLRVPTSLAPFLLLPPRIPIASRSPRLAEPGAVPEPRRAAPGDQLPLRARCHPPVLPALRGHLPLLYGIQTLQEQPLLSHRGKWPPAARLGLALPCFWGAQMVPHTMAVLGMVPGQPW